MMKPHMIAGLSMLVLLIDGAAAQSNQPYAGMQTRPIKALSAQQVGDLKAGRGMGLALAAELNGYPGPMHVLELADRLGLTEQQRAEIKHMFDAMKAEAMPLGEQLIAQESELDRLFASRSITPDRLTAATAAIGASQGALRNTHLKYHLSTAAILSATQMHRYAELRGYAGGNHPPQHHRQH